MTQNAWKYILDRAFLFKLKKGQAAYKQDKNAMPNVYFVLYGEFEYRFNDEPFGEKCGLGWTVGEEVMYKKSDPVKRMESVYALGDACLLQFRVKDLEEMRDNHSSK